MNETYLINKYFSKLVRNNPSALSLNDDVFYDKKSNNVISVDTYVEKTHFPDFKNPDLIIKKIIRASISDLICKGVTPKYYFLSGSGDSKNFNKINLRKISNSLKSEQKKYSIKLSGGDTVYSNKLSFTVTSVGFSQKIILRNKAKLNDDIYVTGNLGDSYAGLNILKKKIITNNSLNKYFESKYYLPDLHLKLSNKLLSFANTSIDISDGLITDLEKLLNKQQFSYKLELDNIPISKNLKKLLIQKKLDKRSYISQGDDYQILFTANSSKSRIINKTAKTLGIKISKIGKICSYQQKSQIIDEKGKKIAVKTKGYTHRF